MVLQDHVGSPVVAVSRLPDRTDVDQHLLAAQGVVEIDFLGSKEIQIFGENAGDVRVPLETILVDKPEDSFHFSLVIDVLGKDIFVQRIAG